MKVKKSSSSFQRQYGQLDDDDDDDDAGDSVSVFLPELPIAKRSGSGGHIGNDADQALVPMASSSPPSSSFVPIGNDNRTRIKSESRSPSGHKKKFNNLSTTTSKSDRSKSPSTSRRLRRKKKELVRQDGCGGVGVINASVTAVATAAEAVTFAQLELSKGVHEDEIVIGWVRNVGSDSSVALNRGSRHNDTVSNPPPRRRFLKDSKSTSSATASPGSRRSQEQTGDTPPGEKCCKERKQAVEKGNADNGEGLPPVTKRSSSQEKKQRRRKLKAECLNVSSEMEIGWHRNAGPLTEKEQTPNVVEKPASISSVKAQYIPAHLRVYGAKTVMSSPSPKRYEETPKANNSVANSFSPGAAPELSVPMPLSNNTRGITSSVDSVPEGLPAYDIADGATKTERATIDSQTASQMEAEVRPRGRRMPRRSSLGIGLAASPSWRSDTNEISMTWRRERVAARARASSRDRKPRVTSYEGGDNLTGKSSVDDCGCDCQSEANKLAYATLRRARARSSDKDGEVVIGTGKLEKPPRNRSFDHSGRREKPKRNASLGSRLPPRQGANFNVASSCQRMAQRTSESAE